MLGKSVQLIAEVLFHDVFYKSCCKIKTLGSVWRSRQDLQRTSEGFRFHHDPPPRVVTSAARLSTWLICPSVWSPGGSISHQYSFITQRSPRPALTWRTKHEMTNDAVKCSTQLGAAWTHVSRCLCLSRESRRRDDWLTWRTDAPVTDNLIDPPAMELISELKQKHTFGIQFFGTLVRQTQNYFHHLRQHF